MKPPPFTYHRPGTSQEVDSLLADLGADAKILAGGQSLIPILNMRLATPSHLIDINHLSGEPQEPVAAEGYLRTGALVRHEIVEQSSLVKDVVPLLHEAMPHVAHPAIRSRGTVAGSIAHADPAAELPAVLIVLEGSVSIRSTERERTIAAVEFFAGPLENSLREGEWVSAVNWPVHAGTRGYAFEEFARRRGDYALCGVAVTVAPRSDGSLDAALSYLGMGDVPQRFAIVCDLEEVDEAVGRMVAEELEPPADLHAGPAYRAHLARRLGSRAIRRAATSASEAA